MKNIIMSGFKPEDRNVIYKILTNTGFKCKIINEYIKDELLNAKEEIISVMGVYNGNDLKAIRSITTDASNHEYIFGVTENERGLSFNASLYTDIPLFYLPPNEKEILKITNIIKNKLEEKRSETSLFKGLIDLKMNFEWPTPEVRISRTCHFLSELLTKTGYYNSSTEEAHSALALEEALVNSIEHGNLELDSSLKQSDVLFNDKYEELKTQRLKDPNYNKRKIKIKVTIDKEISSIIISDEGKGFDTARSEIAMNTNEKPPIEQIMEHSGKGFSLIKKAFDNVQYNSKGTEIILMNSMKI
jgi:anti-sigma regulatory factor (Ser/Thr protein kinase)/CxxC motif-containing protein